MTLMQINFVNVYMEFILGKMWQCAKKVECILPGLALVKNLKKRLKMKVREFVTKAKATHFLIGSASGYFVISTPERFFEECEKVNKSLKETYKRKYKEAMEVLAGSVEYREKHERAVQTWREKAKYYKRKGDYEAAERCKTASEREKMTVLRSDDRVIFYKRQKERMKHLLETYVDVQEREIRDKYNSDIVKSDIILIVPGEEQGRYLYVDEWEKEQKNEKDK